MSLKKSIKKSIKSVELYHLLDRELESNIHLLSPKFVKNTLTKNYNNLETNHHDMQ